MSRRGNHARLFDNGTIEVIAVEAVEYFTQTVNTKKFVHFRDFFGEFLLVTLRETAKHKQTLDFALVFEVDVVHNGVDALLLGVENEAASVDKYDVGSGGIVGVAAVAENDVVPAVDARGDVLAVNEVFAATECYDCEFLFVHLLIIVLCLFVAFGLLTLRRWRRHRP